LTIILFVRPRNVGIYSHLAVTMFDLDHNDVGLTLNCFAIMWLVLGWVIVFEQVNHLSI